MKFHSTEISGKKEIRYSFALGKSEASILLSLLQNGIQYTPKNIRTSSTISRMRNMKRAISKALKEMKQFTKDDLNEEI